MWGFGFRIKTTKLSITDFITDYEPVQDTTHAGISVSNHSGILDMFYYAIKNVSFLSKSELLGNPILSNPAIVRQGIFIDREDKKDREKIIDIIKNRADLASKGLLPSLMIFPEGTVTNGRSLMKFKRGAFCHTKPIKIYLIKYNGRHVHSICNVCPIPSIILTICQFWGSVEIFEIEENFDPLFVYKKYGIDYENDEDAWKYVAKEVKEVMGMISGFELTEAGFRDNLKIETSEALSHSKMTFSGFPTVIKHKIRNREEEEKAKLLGGGQKKQEAKKKTR